MYLVNYQQQVQCYFQKEHLKNEKNVKKRNWLKKKNVKKRNWLKRDRKLKKTWLLMKKLKKLKDKIKMLN